MSRSILIAYFFVCANTVFAKTGSDFTSLTEALRTPQLVVSLTLKSNGLTELPPEIGNFVNLERLNVSGNRLTTLPPELFTLTKLKYLNVNSNRLSSLPQT